MFCQYCGNKLSDTARFCGKCGQRVISPPVANAVSAAEPASVAASSPTPEAETAPVDAFAPVPETETSSVAESAQSVDPDKEKNPWKYTDFAPKGSRGRIIDRLPAEDKSHLYYLASKIKGFQYAENSKIFVDNALSGFAVGVNRNSVLFIVDTSFLSSNKGFLFTDEKMYYIARRTKVVVDYAEYLGVERKESEARILLSNDLYVNITADMIEFMNRLNEVTAFLDLISALYREHDLCEQPPNDFIHTLTLIVRRHQNTLCDAMQELSLIGNINAKKFESACAKYAGNAKFDQCILLIDDTVFGSGKNGMMITVWGIFCKDLSDAKISVYFNDIDSIEHESEKTIVKLKNGTRLPINASLVKADVFEALVKDILAFYRQYLDNWNDYEHSTDAYNYRMFLQSDAERMKTLPVKALEFQFDSGNPYAGIELANRYLNGQDVEQNAEKAISICKKISHPIAYRMLGELYFAGNGVEKSTTKAEEHFKQADMLGDLESHVSIANFRFLGINGSVNYNKAFCAYSELAKNIPEDKLPESLKHNLGVCYKYGYGCQTDTLLAEKWFNQVVDINTSAKFMLADLYICDDDFKEKRPLAVEYLEQLTQQKYTPAVGMLGRLCAEGTIVEQDIPRAFFLLQQAADTDDIEATYQLGSLSVRVPENGISLEKAFELIKKAADAGHIHAIRDCAVMYQFGLGTHKDICTAKNMYDKSAAMGDTFSQKWKEHTKLFLNTIRAVDYIYDDETEADAGFYVSELDEAPALDESDSANLTTYLFQYRNYAMAKAVAEKKESAARKFSYIESNLHNAGIASVNAVMTNTIFQYFTKFGQRQAKGHGLEYATHVDDLLHFRFSRWIGGENARGGADRTTGIFNQTQLQDKCFSYTPQGKKEVLKAAEDYPNQTIELNSDWFSDGELAHAVKQEYEEKHGSGSFEKKFKNSGYTDKQCQNFAKFGNIDSLKVDIRAGRVAARGSLLISGAITFGMAKISGAETSDAAKQALKAGIRSYGMTLVSTTVTAQLLKTETIRHFVQSEDMIFKFANQKGVKNVLSKATHGEINVNSTNPLHGPGNIVKSAMVSSAVTTLILSVPDILNVIQNRESGRQMAVNVATTASSVAAGSVGYYLGAACGSVVPVVGTFIGGMIGASIASSLASNATRGILTEILGDDSKEMLEIFNSELAKIAQDYLLAEDEINYVVDTLQSNGALSPKRMQDIFAAEDRPKFCQKLITPTVEEVCELRNFIVTPPENQMADYLGEIIEAEFTEIPEESPEDISEESVE